MSDVADLQALVVAENALSQNVIMCERAEKAGIDHAGPLRVVTQQALNEVRRALGENDEPGSDNYQKGEAQK